MDLLNKLKTLRNTTTSPEVKAICESNIQKIEKGDSNINPDSIMESIQNFERVDTPSQDPYQIMREQELTRSKNAANRLMESWGGVGNGLSKNSGSYVESEKEQTPKVDYTSLNENLSALASQDKGVEAFMKSEEVNNLGVFEGINTIRNSGIFEHPSIKIICEKYYHLLKSKNMPEFLVAEGFLQEMKNFDWDERVQEITESLSEKLTDLRPEIEVSKALYTISSNAGSDFYSPVTESLNKWLVSENKSISLLTKDISRWQFNPIVRNLLNNLSLMEQDSSKLNIPIHAGNSSVRRVFSPVLVEGGKTIFTIGSNVFEGSSQGLKKLNRGQVAVLPKNFISVLESFYAPYVKVDENGLNVFVGKHKFSLIEEGESVSILFNGKSMKFQDKVNLSKAIGLEISGSLGMNENKIVYDILNLYENFFSIVELDFAKRIESKVYEGASVNLIKWENKIFLNRINESMSDNSVFEVNGTQATNMVREFLKYDISEGLTEFLDGESRIKSIMLNDRKRLMENITVLEGQLQKVESQMGLNPLFANSPELQRAQNLLERELSSLRKKWSAVNTELQKIENEPLSFEEVYEDDKFNVGEYVKVLESGNTGKIISIDSTSGSYTVLMDNGRTGDFKIDEIINLDDALSTAGDENEVEAETQEELKEASQQLATAPGKSAKEKKDATPGNTMRKNTEAAPKGKDNNKGGQKDVENLKDANLEEAPEGKETHTKYKATKGAGYNLSEDTRFSKSDVKLMKLSETPGSEEGDADYEVKGIRYKSKNPQVMKTDPNFASAPGSEKGKELHYKVDDEMGYNVDEKTELEKTNQNLAVAPGKSEGDAGYGVKTIKGKAHSPQVMKTDPNFAVAPSKGSEGRIGYKSNPEMGYNIDESEESKKN